MNEVFHHRHFLLMPTSKSSLLKVARFASVSQDKKTKIEKSLVGVMPFVSKLS
jgi:hypothetical protein